MENGNKYRLQKINDIQQILNDERFERDTLSKRYHRAVGLTVINGVDTLLSGVTIALGSAVVCLLSTSFITAPVLNALEAVVVGTEVVCIVGNQTNKKLVRKAEKHEKKIKILAEAKLSSITDFISKTLTDDKYRKTNIRS